MNIWESRRTPNPHFFQVLGFTATLGQSGVATVVDVNLTTRSKVTKEHVFKDKELRKIKSVVD